MLPYIFGSMANKCLLKSFLCHFSCWITRIANSYRGRMTFDRFRFCKGEYRGNPTKQRGTPKRPFKTTLLPSSLPCPVALRGVSEEIYRRVREINPYSQKILYTIFFNHSPRRYRSSVSLIWLRNTGDV